MDAGVREDREPPPKGRMPREQRERMLIATAEGVFSRRGFRAASMEEIAREANVDRALLYQYFGGKRGLYETCVNAALEELQELVTHAITGIDQAADADSQREISLTGVRVFFEFVKDHGAGWDVLFGAGWAVESDDGEKPILDMMQFVINMLKVHYNDAPERNMRATAAYLLGASWAVSLWWRGQEEMTIEEITVQHVDQCLAALDQLALTIPQSDSTGI